MTSPWPRLVCLLLLVLTGLGGCAGRTYYSDFPEPTPPVAAQTVSEGQDYRVERGDSLYSISFATGRDWRVLAAINGIGPPYTIYPGQRLRLGNGSEQLPAAPEVALPASSPASSPAPKPETQQTVSGPGVSSATAKPSTPVASTPVAKVPVMPVDQRPAPKPGAWRWPATGALIRSFSTGSQPHKGIDIAGKAGDPVFAANSGTVVYAGNGVRGYGNLLIVKHDALFLSAYAHNSRLLVKEGDMVEGGQKIAEIGDSGTDRVKLHFEVRKQGNPVDPIRILPRR